MINCGNLMGYTVGYFPMEIWGVLARSWGDYQPGATLALHESGLNAEPQVQFPFFAVDPRFSIHWIYIIGIFLIITPFLSFASCSAQLSVHCSKLQCWLSLFLFIWGVGERRLEPGNYFAHLQGVQQQPQMFYMAFDWFPAECLVWHCYWKWQFYS